MTDDKIQEDLFERLNYGVFHAAALKAGIHLDLFTPLKDGPMSLEQLARSLGVDALRLRPLLYALVVVGLLNVDSDRFANTADADRYLVGDSPDNRLENLKGYANRWDMVLKTAESIRTGVPQSKIDYETMLPKDLEAFLRGLHWGTMREGQALAESDVQEFPRWSNIPKPKSSHFPNYDRPQIARDGETPHEVMRSLLT